MSLVLRQHIGRFVQLSDADFEGVLSFFTPVDIKKKQNLLTEGQICRQQYFVEKGCLRLFFTSEKGVEKTVQFAIESWWMADYFSFQNKQPSEFCVQAVENSRILAIDYASNEAMLAQHPSMERYFRLVHQKAHAAAQRRTMYMHDYSREEMYRHFSQAFPEFVQRIPQYLVASYLGFTPEYLSELRAKGIS